MNSHGWFAHHDRIYNQGSTVIDVAGKHHVECDLYSDRLERTETLSPALGEEEKRVNELYY